LELGEILGLARENWETQERERPMGQGRRKPQTVFDLPMGSGREREAEGVENREGQVWGAVSPMSLCRLLNSEKVRVSPLARSAIRRAVWVSERIGGSFLSRDGGWGISPFYPAMGEDFTLTVGTGPAYLRPHQR